jgi:glutathione S-transferase
MLTIYGRDYSSNVQLVMWAVGELGLGHERLDYGHKFGGTGTDEFRAMNPNGLVPVMRDGEVVMFESAAILRYLAARYGDAVFWPADPAVRGPLDTWAEWGKTSFAPAANRVFGTHVVTPPSKRSPATMAEAVAAVVPLAKILDARIGAGPWLAGAGFSFADLGVGHILHRYYTVDWDRPATPALDAYWERLKDRPAYAAHAMVSFEPLRGHD